MSRRVLKSLKEYTIGMPLDCDSDRSMFGSFGLLGVISFVSFVFCCVACSFVGVCLFAKNSKRCVNELHTAPNRCILQPYAACNAYP